MPASTSLRDQLAVVATFVVRMRRAWRAGVVGLLVAVAATAGITFSTHHLYRSEALLAWEGGSKDVAGGELISSRGMAERVADMVNSRQSLGAIIKEMNLYPRVVDKLGMVEATDEMRKRLKVTSREGMTYLVTYDGESRDQARDVLQKIVDTVVDSDRRRKSQEAEESRRFLEAERKRADEDLRRKEAALSAFVSEHPQLASEVGRAASGGLIRAADRDRAGVMTGDVASLEMQAAQIEQSLASLGDQGIRTTAGGVSVDSKLLLAQTRAEADLQAARADLIDKQARLTDVHPDVKAAVRRVAAAEVAVRRTEAAVVAARASAPPPVDPGGSADDQGDGRVAALKRALAAVRQQIAATRSRSAPRPELPKASGSMVSIDTDWTRLNREVSEAQERQGQIQGKQFQADMAAALIAAGEGGHLVIADKAFRPLRPIAGRRAKVAMIGAFASVMLALLVMGAFAAFDEHLYAAADIQRVVDEGFVVVIPWTQSRVLLPPGGEDSPATDVGSEKARG